MEPIQPPREKTEKAEDRKQQELLERIDNPFCTREERLRALALYLEGENKESERKFIPSSHEEVQEVNNHIHTVYSFSPYTPAMAALRAWQSGLGAAGSVDHDSVGAAEEMKAACALVGIGSCVGFEVRVSFKTDRQGNLTPFKERKINNPDSPGIAYMTVQGIPSPSLGAAHQFLDPVRKARYTRSRRMVERLNQKLLESSPLGPLSFENHVVPLSLYHRGGTITERHILAALAQRCMAVFGRGQPLLMALEEVLHVQVPPRLVPYLLEENNPHYIYDLLGIFKTEILPLIYVEPDEIECPPVHRVVDFARTIGAIPAYAYLGDVSESPTGDKKAEQFEDSYLDELFSFLKMTGFQAVTYMPPRNSREQLRRVQRLCAEYGFMEISGVDINSSRQSFRCPQVVEPEFRHLVDTTWALIAHERLASVRPSLGLFSSTNPWKELSLKEQLDRYATIGKGLNRKEPEKSAHQWAERIEQGGWHG
ncbi:MAG: PHP domain-containing protein [Treponemataceae bacterium]|nr:PHP domain-containing protein [Treponemataceae bacterium]